MQYRGENMRENPRMERESYRYDRTKGRTKEIYLYGNAVPKPEREPDRIDRRPEKKRTSRQVRINRRRALNMNPGYVMFLLCAVVCAMLVCMNYIHIQTRINERSDNITRMQQQLERAREENNTRYNSVMNTAGLNEIRTRAEELGMVYASPDQIREYSGSSSDYVKQYEDIPEDGTLARSKKE